MVTLQVLVLSQLHYLLLLSLSTLSSWPPLSSLSTLLIGDISSLFLPPILVAFIFTIFIFHSLLLGGFVCSARCSLVGPCHIHPIVAMDVEPEVTPPLVQPRKPSLKDLDKDLEEGD